MAGDKASVREQYPDIRIVPTHALQNDTAGILHIVGAKKEPLLISVGEDYTRNQVGSIVAAIIPAEDFKAFLAFRKASAAILEITNLKA